MSRVIYFTADLGEFKTGETLDVEDQIAVDAVAQGFAVPSSYPADSVKPAKKAAAPMEKVSE